MATIHNEVFPDTQRTQSSYAVPLPAVNSPPESIPAQGAHLEAKSETPAPQRQLGKRPAAKTDPHRKNLSDGISWGNVGWLTALHVGALAAPFTFTWQGLVLLVVLHWLTGGIGICLGFHRLFTHSSFSTYRPVRWLIAWIGGLAGEGSIIDWVANHRKHHALSDKEGDPHSPHDGPWWSHVLWTMGAMSPQNQTAHVQRWAPDLYKDPVMRFLARTFLVWHFVSGLALFGMGYYLGGLFMACSLLVWGLFLRLVLVLHSTWFVNSASHIWGYRNYKTTDDSRNNWWVALVTYGEGWHNNHHAYPRMANHGHRWWEIDLTFRTIRLMERIGLAWNVVDYKSRRDPR